LRDLTQLGGALHLPVDPVTLVADLEHWHQRMLAVLPRRGETQIILRIN